MLSNIPVGEKRQLTRQQRVVIGRQYIGFGRQLPAHQRIDRLHVKRMVGLSGLCDGVHSRRRRNDLHHGLCAQIAQQHETCGLVPGQHAGCGQARGGHQAGHFHKRVAVFLVRWGVHDDAAAASGFVDSEIAPKAGVG